MTLDKARIDGTVREVVEGEGAVWAERGFFVVEVACKGVAGDEIEVTVDSDGEQGIGIDDCALLSREISARITDTWLAAAGGDAAAGGEEPDFSLVVMSAGLGQPLKLGRQYRKLMTRALGRDALPRVDVLFRDGRKLNGVVLCGIGYDNAAATETEVAEDVPAAIEVMYEVRELLPGKKRKELVECREQIDLADTKSVSEYFDFK